MVFKKAKRVHRTVRKSPPIKPGPGAGVIQPGAGVIPPGAGGVGVRVANVIASGLKSRAGAYGRGNRKTKFETLTNQQNTNVSQYVPATTMAAAVPASTPLWYDVPKSVRKPRRGRKIYPKPTAPPGGSGQIYLPDGSPYEPGATYQFHGDGTYTKIPGPMDGEEV